MDGKERSTDSIHVYLSDKNMFIKTEFAIDTAIFQLFVWKN